jgi:anti-anti-sigma regulatory factor
MVPIPTKNPGGGLVPFDIATDGEAHIIRVSGAANVRIVSDVRAALLAAAEQGVSATIDLSEATSVDAAFFQLVVSSMVTEGEGASAVTVVDPKTLVSRVF